jgi:hypothetical protein
VKAATFSCAACRAEDDFSCSFCSSEVTRDWT